MLGQLGLQLADFQFELTPLGLDSLQSGIELIARAEQLFEHGPLGSGRLETRRLFDRQRL